MRHESTPTFYDRFEEAFLREDTEFVQTVREDRVPPLTLRDATEATRIAIAIQQSLRERRVISVSGTARTSTGAVARCGAKT